MPFIETERLRIHYRTHGNPTGIPMVLLHGSFAGSRWWDEFMTLLPDEIYAVAPDLRGMGATDRPADGYAIPALADDLHALLTGLDLHAIDLVGHSAGGAVAIEYALQHPERLATLTLIAPPPVEGVRTPLEGLRLLEAMRHDRELLARGMATLWPEFGRQPPIDAAAGLLDDAARQAPPAFTEIAVALGSWNRREEAVRLTLPTLLIWGDEDAIVDQASITRTLLSIPGAANLEILHGAGHSPMLTDPLLLAEKIVTFVTEDAAGFAQIRDTAIE
ncbi:MAG: alpha/beta hydrolase [Caldilineaceae bacterium]|nr:alpha/beta hydrolase [Caldilineaceae bacterium]